MAVCVTVSEVSVFKKLKGLESYRDLTDMSNIYGWANSKPGFP